MITIQQSADRLPRLIAQAAGAGDCFAIITITVKLHEIEVVGVLGHYAVALLVAVNGRITIVHSITDQPGI